MPIYGERQHRDAWADRTIVKTMDQQIGSPVKSDNPSHQTKKGSFLFSLYWKPFWNMHTYTWDTVSVSCSHVYKQKVLGRSYSIATVLHESRFLLYFHLDWKGKTVKGIRTMKCSKKDETVLFFYRFGGNCHSFYLFLFSQIHTIQSSVFISRGLSPFSSLLLSSERKPPWGTKPRFELGPALQQASAQPTEPRYFFIKWFRFKIYLQTASTWHLMPRFSYFEIYRKFAEFLFIVYRCRRHSW
jgi:hypothetical protein